MRERLTACLHSSSSVVGLWMVTSVGMTRSGRYPAFAQSRLKQLFQTVVEAESFAGAHKAVPSSCSVGKHTWSFTDVSGPGYGSASSPLIEHRIVLNYLECAKYGCYVSEGRSIGKGKCKIMLWSGI